MAKKQTLPEQAILHEFLSYDPSTGLLKWKKRDRKWFNSDRKHKTFNKLYAGEIAGNKDRVLIRWNMDRYTIIHVIYKWMTGKEGNVFYKDFDKTNTKWENIVTYNTLSEARFDHRHVSKINKSGKTGVAWNKQTKKWTASIRINYKQIHLGSFNNYKDAVKVRKDAEVEIFGFNCSI